MHYERYPVFCVHIFVAKAKWAMKSIHLLSKLKMCHLVTSTTQSLEGVGGNPGYR